MTRGDPRPRVVAVGGGHGLARALGSLRELGLAPTAIVTVADDGGSSGRLRRDLGIIALGDLRMALLALARNALVADLFAHRFDRGELEGHAVGNLALLALAEQRDGDYVAAVQAAAAVLACYGKVLPATTVGVKLKAEVEGREVGGQVRVATAEGRIDRVWLEPPDPPAPAEVSGALRDADAVILGPGSLYTSVIATLLVPGLARALRESSARVIYVANLLTQPGETSGLDMTAHVDALVEHVPGLTLDTVVAHEGPPPTGPGSPLVDTALRHDAVRTVVRADLAERSADGQVRAAHDRTRLATTLAEVLKTGSFPGSG